MDGRAGGEECPRYDACFQGFWTYMAAAEFRVI